jgi:hypothetical protein
MATASASASLSRTDSFDLPGKTKATGVCGSGERKARARTTKKAAAWLSSGLFDLAVRFG